MEAALTFSMIHKFDSLCHPICRQFTAVDTSPTIDQPGHEDRDQHGRQLKGYAHLDKAHEGLVAGVQDQYVDGQGNRLA